MEFAQSTSENEVNAATGPNQRQVWQGQMFMRVEGKTRVLDNVRSDHTVRAIKERVLGVHRLVFGGKELDDGATLGTCGIEKDATIDTLLRARGGMRSRLPSRAGRLPQLPPLNHSVAVQQEIETKSYLEAHGIRALLSGMTKEVVRHRPTDPVTFMHQHLGLRLKNSADVGQDNLRESIDLLFLDEEALRTKFDEHAAGPSGLKWQEVSLKNDITEPLGLKWKRVGTQRPQTGNEIHNVELASAMQRPPTGSQLPNTDLASAMQEHFVEFTREEWGELKVWDELDESFILSHDSFIRAGRHYFTPQGHNLASTNPNLAPVLEQAWKHKGKPTLTQQEFDGLGIKDLSVHDFIQLKNPSGSDSSAWYQAGPSVMSKTGLKDALNALELTKTHSTQEMETRFATMDLDKDNNISIEEFLIAAKASSHLELVLQQLPIIRALANVLATGDAANPLENYEQMSDSDVDKVVENKFVPMLKAIIKRNLDDLRKGRGPAQFLGDKFASDKFDFPLKGGSLKDFKSDITMRVGEPHGNLEEGMRLEHLESQDSDMEFTTGNYAITSKPSKEYLLAVNGADDVDLDQAEYKGRGSQRRIHPLAWYGDCHHPLDTTPEIVRKAKLTRVEILAIVMFTGPMYWIWNTVLRGEESTPPHQLEILKRCQNAKNNYSSSLHALSSAIVKIQQSGHDHLKANMMVYRGIGGFPSTMYEKNADGHFGMTEFGMSSTASTLASACNYGSGFVAGTVATVLAVQTGQIDSPACIAEFTQYPREYEFVWLPLSYIQIIKGKDEIKMTKVKDRDLGKDGEIPVRILHVRMNCNTSTLTIEQLAVKQRKALLDKASATALTKLREIFFNADLTEKQFCDSTLAGGNQVKNTQAVIDVLREFENTKIADEKQWNDLDALYTDVHSASR